MKAQIIYSPKRHIVTLKETAWDNNLTHDLLGRLALTAITTRNL